MFWHQPWRPYAGVISDGFGSGGSPSPYIVDPLSGFVAAGKKQERPVAVDGFFSDDPTFGTVVGETGPIVPLDNMLETADAALVFVAAVAMEGYDRTTLEVRALPNLFLFAETGGRQLTRMPPQLLNNGSALIEYVASHHNNTIVVVEAPGQVDMSGWTSHPNVTSILFTYLGGQEMGHAIANVAFGDVNPSGKLPITIAKNVSDYPLNLYNGTAKVDPIANFTEGVFIDYKVGLLPLLSCFEARN